MYPRATLEQGDRVMKILVTAALTASALMAATAASAQVKKPAADPPPRPVQAESQTVTAQSIPTNPDASVTQPRPLFNIGNVPVDVWAPVEAPYDANMSRNQAANPVFEEGGF
jgi:hypothetical protein